MALNPLQNLLQRYDRPIQLLCQAGFAASIVVVCLLSLLPAEELPKVRNWDKFFHLIAYMEIAAVGLIGFRSGNWKLRIVVGVIALGGVLEIAQHFVPGRSADPIDFVVNGLGVLLGFLFARLILRSWPTTNGQYSA